MKTFPCRPWILVALVASLGSGCSDDSAASKVGPALKEAGKDVAQATKDVGGKIGDGLAEAADGLESFAKSVASKVSDTAENVGDSIKSKMPDVESLVDRTKAKLKVGGAEAKLWAARLDEKLVTLKARLADLARDGANATKAMKDDAVDAFEDLVAAIKTGLSKLTG